jgi:ABC-type lipoprotein release transport system permease subunit
MILKMAFRNVMRNRWRTAITVGAMGFALMVMILYSGLFEGMFRMFRQNAIRMDLSHIQIHAREYRTEHSIYQFIENSDQLIARLESVHYPCSPRLYGYGLAASGMSSSGVKMRGVDVSREIKVTDLYKHMDSGYWLDAADPKGVVIGKKLAKSLNAAIGSEIIIVSQASDGSVANDIYFVRGILKYVSEDMDRAGFFMTIPAFRELMSYQSGAHEIAVQVPEEMPLESARKNIQTLAPELEVMTWRELAPAIAQLLDSFKISMYILYFIAYSAVAIVMMNATLMAVFERIREYGIMKALGSTPLQIMTLVFAETLVQAIAASAIGLSGGWAVTLYLNRYGLDLSRLASGTNFSGIAFDPVWRSAMTTGTFTEPWYFMLLMVFASTLYPGFKAALVRPIKAIFSQ